MRLRKASIPNQKFIIRPQQLNRKAPLENPTATEDGLVPQFVQAMYRVLLLRNADQAGLDFYTERIRSGRPVETIMRHFLKSPEFAEKRAHFLETYPSSSSPKSGGIKLELEHITHECEGRMVTFALNKAAKDSYTETLRKGPIRDHFIPFILRRAKQNAGSTKVADFGANVGAVSLPLAANGIRVLAVEALPLNFLALASAAKASGLRNLLPVNMAAMDRKGLVTLQGLSEWATAGVEGGDVTVSCDTLINILQTYDFADADVIKIDIEGAELPALIDADRFFSERPDMEIIFESSNHTCRLFGYDRKDLLRWFEERGYSTYIYLPDGLMPVRYCDPQPTPVVDVLATKRSPKALERQGERIVPMTDEYVVQELLRISKMEHPHILEHFLTEVRRVDDRVKHSPSWPTIMSQVAALEEREFRPLASPVTAIASGDVTGNSRRPSDDKEKLAPLEGKGGSSVAKSTLEQVIFVHSHRRSGTHFVLDTIRAWFDVPDGIQEVPGFLTPSELGNHSLSKDHEPFWGFKLTQGHIWESQEQWHRTRRLYETGTHLYVVRNPLHVLRSAYIFDIHGAEPKFRIDPKTTFLDYITGRSLHERNNGLNRAEYWAQHVKSWCYDERTMVIHYQDLKANLRNMLSGISDHIGLPVRDFPRQVVSTGVATGLTGAFLSKGQPLPFDTDVIDVIRSAIGKIFGAPPWRGGLERDVADWLSAPPTA
jgi:FkbM family methyltransferase